MTGRGGGTTYYAAPLPRWLFPSLVAAVGLVAGAEVLGNGTWWNVLIGVAVIGYVRSQIPRRSTAVHIDDIGISWTRQNGTTSRISWVQVRRARVYNMSPGRIGGLKLQLVGGSRTRIDLAGIPNLRTAVIPAVDAHLGARLAGHWATADGTSRIVRRRDRRTVAVYEVPETLQDSYIWPPTLYALRAAARALPASWRPATGPARRR